jgi:flagellar basal body rod protein FlgB
MSLIQRSMDIRASRHRVLSSNVANIETLEYISRDQLEQNWIPGCRKS